MNTFNINDVADKLNREWSLYSTCLCAAYWKETGKFAHRKIHTTSTTYEMYTLDEIEVTENNLSELNKFEEGIEYLCYMYSQLTNIPASEAKLICEFNLKDTNIPIRFIKR